MTNGEIDTKIIEQLRRKRALERAALHDRLYPAYMKGVASVTKEIDAKIEELNTNQRLYYEKWSNASVFTTQKAKDELYKLYERAQNDISNARDEKNKIIKIYESTSEKNVKLTEFDIETEQMILAHMCEVQLICGNKTALPMLEKKKK